MSNVSKERLRALCLLVLNLDLDVETERVYQKRFEKEARYIGNGVYTWAGIHSTDTGELFQLGVLGIAGQMAKDVIEEKVEEVIEQEKRFQDA